MSAAPIPDLAARRRALDPEQSFIVQAPAGSGKTELLIQRYLLLLACVDHPEEIVAVTFTRKAAGEMRERVLQALAAAATGTAAQTEHEKLTLELATAALRRDRIADWRIADNPARLRIQTIDSLCAALTRQMPILSRFGAQPQTVEDASELYLEAARATINLVNSDDAVAGNLARVLEHLDNDVGRIEALLADMLKRRDHWLRLRGRERAELEAALANVRAEVLQCVRGMIPAALHDELVELARYAGANLAADGRNSPLTACPQLIALPGIDEADVELWRGIVELLVTKSGGEWRKKYDARDGFPSGKSKSEKAAAKRWKERALALIAALSPSDGLCGALRDLRVLPPERYSDPQWHVLGAIMLLLQRAAAQLKVVFQSRGQVDFTEVSQAALQSLGTDGEPTDLALAMDYRIRHLLVDEFQDTSISQYELIARLTAGWEPGDGRTVFAVGDPMQSIYRFREAQVGLFLRTRSSGIGGVELQPISLSANFRSQAGIVEWVNDTFAAIMPRSENIVTGAVAYTASVPTRDALDGAAVNVHAFFNHDHIGEAARVVAIVAAAQAATPEATTAILVRSRGHLREIVSRLKDAGLRFRAIEIEELGHRPVVQDLLALTRALLHPADRLAWLALLRAPWCGLTLADLQALAGDDHVQTIWELMNDSARTAALSADGSARLLRVQTVLKASLEQCARGSLRSRIAGAWFALGGPACAAGETDLEDAEIYFEYLESHEEAGEMPDLFAFEQGLAKLYALPDLQADERLQIMTIHKAKGLEFDVVIVPGLGRTARTDDKRLFLWMEQPRSAPSPNLSPARGGEEQSAPFSLDGRGAGGECGTDLLLAPIQETGADGDAIYAWLQKLEAAKDSLESERLLYVAATRAKRRLHLLGDTRFAAAGDGAVKLNAPAEKTLLAKLWPMVVAVYDETAQRAAASASVLIPVPAGLAPDQSLQRLVAGWRLPATPPQVAWTAPREMSRGQDEIEFSWVGETARHVGSVVHRWLQRIAEEALAGWDAQHIEALRKTFEVELSARGVSANELSAAGARVTAALTQAIADDRGRWLLGAHLDSYNERRITVLIDGERMNLVIDRMFRDADGRQWIVDYKTSGHEGADVAAFLDSERLRYAPQLARYAAVVGDEQQTMLGLYFPLLAGWREWQNK